MCFCVDFFFRIQSILFKRNTLLFRDEGEEVSRKAGINVVRWTVRERKECVIKRETEREGERETERETERERQRDRERDKRLR